MYLVRLATALLACVLASCAAKPSDVVVGDIIIDHVTVLDGAGGAALSDSRVTVRQGRIASVQRSSGSAPAGAKLVDGRGRFLLPGFIDMHVHLLFPRCTAGDGPVRFDRKLSERALARYLDFGITTVRSAATPTVAGLALRDDLNNGVVRGPRALASAELINDSSITDAELRQVVRDALPYRPDYIKAYASLTPDQVSTVIAEAHLHRIPVIGHLQRTTWKRGVELGIDHLVHSVDWSVDSLPPDRQAAYRDAVKGRSGFQSRIDWLEAFDPDAPAQRELVKALARERISVDVTLIAYDGKFSLPSDRRFRRNRYLRSFPDLKEDWTRCDDTTANWTVRDYQRWHAARPKLSAWIKRMADAGVLLVSGTDLTNQWITPGEGLHQEFELLAEAGLTPNQILRLTGANAAEALGREDVGMIEEGRRADLVLLADDPRRSISNTRSIVWVMQSGEIVVRGPPRP
jgi:imidazolonepropionase-like amidohydrolase